MVMSLPAAFDAGKHVDPGDSMYSKLLNAKNIFHFPVIMHNYVHLYFFLMMSIVQWSFEIQSEFNHLRGRGGRSMKHLMYLIFILSLMSSEPLWMSWWTKASLGGIKVTDVYSYM